MRPRPPATALLAAAALVASAGAPARATPVPSAALQIAFTMPSGPGSVYSNAPAQCVLPAYGWSRDSSPRYVGLTEHPRGLLDVPGRSGEAIVPGEAIHVDRIFNPRPRALAATDVGLQLAGGRAYLTGTIRSSRSYSARSPRRVRLAQLHGVALTSRSVRGGLVVTARGRATMLRPLAGMFNRLRCRGARIDEHPVRVGAPLGVVRATIVPARASAAIASVDFGFLLAGDPYGPEPPHVEPTGGTQAAGERLTLAATPGAHLIAACTSSGCDPDEGSVALQGGFDFVAGARRLSVTDVRVELAAGRVTLGGIVGGTPVTSARESSTGEMAVDAALRAQLATMSGDPQLDGFVVGMRLPLAELAPA